MFKEGRGYCLVLLHGQVHFSVLFCSVVRFSLFLRPTVPLLVGLVSICGGLLSDLLWAMSRFVGGCFSHFSGVSWVFWMGVWAG